MASAATVSARSLRGPGRPTSREERLEGAHQLLLAGLAELTSSDGWQRMLTIAARFHTYSTRNVFLILAQRSDATRVAGLRTWNGLGRRVNKGERGIRIIVPITRSATDTSDPDGDETRIAGFTVGTVFDVSQTSGDDLDPITPTLLTGSAPDGIIAGVIGLIEAERFLVTVGDCRPANGVTCWTTRTVTVRDDLQPAAQLKTLLHEAGHVLANDPDNDDQPDSRELKEVEAESIAFIVAHSVGLDTSSYSFPYVAHWANRAGDLAAVRATTERVITYARHILDHLDTHTR